MQDPHTKDVRYIAHCKIYLNIGNPGQPFHIAFFYVRQICDSGFKCVSLLRHMWKSGYVYSNGLFHLWRFHPPGIHSNNQLGLVRFTIRGTFLFLSCYRQRDRQKRQRFSRDKFSILILSQKDRFTVLTGPESTSDHLPGFTPVEEQRARSYHSKMVSEQQLRLPRVCSYWAITSRILSPLDISDLTHKLGQTVRNVWT